MRVNVFAWGWLVRKAKGYFTINPFQDGVPCGDVTTQFAERIHLVNPNYNENNEFYRISDQSHHKDRHILNKTLQSLKIRSDLF